MYTKVRYACVCKCCQLWALVERVYVHACITITSRDFSKQLSWCVQYLEHGFEEGQGCYQNNLVSMNCSLSSFTIIPQLDGYFMLRIVVCLSAQLEALTISVVMMSTPSNHLLVLWKTSIHTKETIGGIERVCEHTTYGCKCSTSAT